MKAICAAAGIILGVSTAGALFGQATNKKKTDEKPDPAPEACATATPTGDVVPVFNPGSAGGAYKRTLVKRNYIEVIYNAHTGKLFWYDYKNNRSGPGTPTVVVIPEQSAFVPVANSHERILVRVCGSHFSSSVTFNPVSTQVPESTLDIRGLTSPSPAAAPAAGGAAPPGGGFLALNDAQINQMLNNLAVAGAGGATVPPTTITPVLNAEATSAVSQYNLYYDAVSRDLNAIMAACPLCAIDTVTAIQAEADTLNGDPSFTAADKTTNQGAFDALFVKTSKLSTEIGNLSSELTAKNFTTAVAQLTTLYSTLVLLDSPSVYGQMPLPAGVPPGTTALVADLNAAVNNKKPQTLKTTLDNLTRAVTTLHDTASSVFKKMNDLHDTSSVSYTNAVTSPTNGIVTVQVSVVDSYVPFNFVANTQPLPTPTPALTVSGGTTSPSQALAFAPTGGTPQQQTGGGPFASPAGAPAATGVPAAGAGAPAGAVTPAGPSAAVPQHVSAQFQIEVHHIANFNLVGGFVVGRISQRTYGFTPNPNAGTSSTGTPLPSSVVTQTQSGDTQFTGLIGMTFYPFGRDFFPGYLGWKRFIPGPLIATSFTSTSTFMVGGDFEFVNGLDIYAGEEWGPVARLNGTYVGAVFPVATGTVPTTQTLKHGVFFGIGFDLATFTAIFK